MKIQIKGLDNGLVVTDTKVAGHVRLSEVFGGVGILTEDDHLFGIAQRDTGLEVKCPDGTLVEIKVGEDGKVFVATHPGAEMGRTDA